MSNSQSLITCLKIANTYSNKLKNNRELLRGHKFRKFSQTFQGQRLQGRILGLGDPRVLIGSTGPVSVATTSSMATNTISLNAK